MLRQLGLDVRLAGPEAARHGRQDQSDQHHEATRRSQADNVLGRHLSRFLVGAWIWCPGCHKESFSLARRFRKNLF
jgi:hypothetical protein